MRLRILVLIMFFVFILLSTSCDSHCKAREKMEEMKIEYTLKRYEESILNNQIKTIRLFLESGMNPNHLIEKSNESVLAASCKAGNLELAELLIKHGANVNDRYFNDHTV